MSVRVSDEEWTELDTVAMAFLPSRALDLFDRLQDELTELRALRLTDDDLAALAAVLHLAENSVGFLADDDDMRSRALAVLDRLTRSTP